MRLNFAFSAEKLLWDHINRLFVFDFVFSQDGDIDLKLLGNVLAPDTVVQEVNINDLAFYLRTIQFIIITTLYIVDQYLLDHSKPF